MNSDIVSGLIKKIQNELIYSLVMSQREFMFKKVSIFVFILFIGFIAGWLSNLVYMEAEIRKGYASSLTSGLENDFAIIESLKSSGFFTPYVKKQFDEKFSLTVHLLMIAKPDYEEMTAIPTKGLCKLGEYHAIHGISVNEIMDSNIDTYFNYVGPIIRSEMQKIQTLVGGVGCEIGGANANNGVCRFRDPARCKNET
jgi:hypothetical protein